MSQTKIDQQAWPYIKNFRTYIDIGAHDGDTSYPYVKKFSKVVAFEPNPLTFKKIPNSIEKYNLALGDIKEQTVLVLPNNKMNNPAHGSISRYKVGTGIKEFVVQVATLDDYNFSDVDFIKIDVEHYELKVCKGAIKTISKWKPTLFFENKRNEADDVIDWLKSLNIGYNVKKFKSDTVAYVDK